MSRKLHFAGLQCDRCDDGYYDDSDEDAEVLTCAECGCNNNIDENSVGNCNRLMMLQLFTSLEAIMHFAGLLVMCVHNLTFIHGCNANRENNACKTANIFVRSQLMEDYIL